VEEAKSGNDLVFSHLHRFPDHARENAERQLSNRERQESIGQALGMIQLDRMPGLESTGQLGRALRLHPDDAGLRLERPDGGGDASDETPAAHRHQNGLHLGIVF
jgi:hypothetical protein